MSWPTVPLGEACEIRIGRTPSRSRPEFWGGDNRWLSIADMSQGRDIRVTRERITDIALDRAAAALVDPGTVLLSFKLSIGKVGIARVPLHTNEAIAALPIRSGVPLHPEFLAYALEAAALSESANRAAMGATLNKTALANVAVPLPPLDEQRRIAAILDRAEGLLTGSKTVAAEAAALARSTVEKWLDHRPGYTTRPLQDWLDPERPITYGILKPGPDLVDGIPYVRVADIQQGEVRLEAVRRTSQDIHHQYRRSTLARGDLLISIRGHVGRLAVVPPALEGANITQDSARLAVAHGRAAYVRAMLESDQLQRWMHQRKKGVAVTGINLGDLRHAPIPDVSQAEQDALVGELASISRLTSANRERLSRLDAMRDSLRIRAFNGEL